MLQHRAVNVPQHEPVEVSEREPVLLPAAEYFAVGKPKRVAVVLADVLAARTPPARTPPA